MLASLTPSSLLLASGLTLHLWDHDCLLHATCPALLYLDPVLCLVSVTVMVASAYSDLVQNGSLLLQAVPPCVDLLGLKQGLNSLCGPGGHHELHVWALAPDQAVASFHLYCTGPEAYQDLLAQAQPLLNRHGVKVFTVQPEFGVSGASGSCTLSCGPACTGHLCCDPREPKIGS
ncbi:proton-coupled zinc antiporter SLC30A1-like [Ascaphus truei]|uniref:proton-coupled zinc antiporter SLC30A1-like n=1 Tax=Ascaphus truei TaxID=8439 RepID=UPI003F5A64BE